MAGYLPIDTLSVDHPLPDHISGGCVVSHRCGLGQAGHEQRPAQLAGHFSHEGKLNASRQ